MDSRIRRGLTALYLRSYVQADDPAAARRNALLFGLVVFWAVGVLGFGVALLGDGVRFARELGRDDLLTFLDGFAMASVIAAVAVPPLTLATELRDNRTLGMLRSLLVPRARARPWLLLLLLALPAAVVVYLGAVCFVYLVAGGGVGLATGILASTDFALFLLVWSLASFVLSLAFVEVLATRAGKYATIGAATVLLTAGLILFLQFPESTLGVLGGLEAAGVLNLSPVDTFVRRPLVGLAVLAPLAGGLGGVAYRLFTSRGWIPEEGTWEEPGRSAPRFTLIGAGKRSGARRLGSLLRKDVTLLARQPGALGWLFFAAIVYALIPALASAVAGFPSPHGEAALATAVFFGATGTYLAGLSLSGLAFVEGRCVSLYRADPGLWRAWVGAKLSGAVFVLAAVAAGLWAVYRPLLGGDAAWFAGCAAVWVPTAGAGGLAAALRYGMFERRPVRMSAAGKGIYLLGSAGAVTVSVAVSTIARVRPEEALVGGIGTGVAALTLASGLLVAAARHLRRADL